MHADVVAAVLSQSANSQVPAVLRPTTTHPLESLSLSLSLSRVNWQVVDSDSETWSEDEDAAMSMTKRRTHLPQQLATELQSATPAHSTVLPSPSFTVDEEMEEEKEHMNDSVNGNDNEDNEPSVIIHSIDVMPATASSATGTSTTATTKPTPPNWQSELRSQWEDGAQQLSEKLRQARASARTGVQRAEAPEQLLQNLSPLVQSLPPLQGDVEWNKEYKKVDKETYYKYLHDSKLGHYRFHRMTCQISSMFLPVTLFAVLILLYTEILLHHSLNPFLATSILVYKQENSDSTSRKFTGSLLVSLTVLAGITAITTVFIVCSYFELRKTLRWFLIAVIAFLLLPWVYFSYQTVRYYSIPVDGISFVLFQWNMWIVALVALIYAAETRSWFNRCALLALSMGVCWPFMEFSEWNVWVTLVVLTIYDLIAVLTPCGPLKWIMDKENAAKLSGIKPPLSQRLPGLMYHGKYFMLGLGDLIFYGALMGRAAKEGVMTLVTTWIGVLFGVAGTILWSYHTRANAIPALPLSVLFGLSFYAATALSIEPFMGHMAIKGYQF